MLKLVPTDPTAIKLAEPPVLEIVRASFRKLIYDWKESFFRNRAGQSADYWKLVSAVLASIVFV